MRGMGSSMVRGLLAWPALLLCQNVIAAAGDPLSVETAVSTVSAGDQNAPAIASAADGRSVIAWVDSTADGDGSGVYARVYRADGNPLTAVIQLHSNVAGNQDQVRVAMQADGRFAAVWRSEVTATSSDPQIIARSFDAAGNPLSAEITLDTGLFSDRQPAIAVDGQGRYTASWTSIGIISPTDGFEVVARRFTGDGSLSGNAFLVNATTTDTQSNPAIACGLTGQCAVAWQSFNQDGELNGIYMRTLASNNTLGTETAVNTVGTKDQNSAAIAMHPDGRFLVVWTDFNLDGDNAGIGGRRFDAAGAALETPRVINLTTAGAQSTPSVAVDANGNYLIAWRGATQDGDGDAVVLRAMLADGSLAATEVIANSFTAGNQNQVRAALDADGDALLSWTSAAQDGDGAGVYQRRFVGPAQINLSSALSLTNSTVRPGGPVALSARVNNLSSSQSPTGSSTINAGINAGNNLSASLSLPAGASTSNGTGSSWICTDNSGAQACNHQAIVAAAQSSTISFSGTAPSTAGSYTYSFNVSSPHDDANGTDNASTATLQVANPTVSFSPGSASLSEAGGTAIISFNVSPASGSTVSIPYTVSGAAVSGSDFSLAPASPISIAAGASSATLQITGLDDAETEGDESFTITLGTPSGAELASSTPISVTVLDNESPPIVEFETRTTQIDENGGALQIFLRLSNSSSNSISVPFTLSGTASSSDYSLSTASPLTIPAGQTRAQITLTPNDDLLTEEDESVNISLGTPSGASLGSGSTHTAQILDNERRSGPPVARFELGSSQFGEAVGTANITVVLSRAAPSALSIPLSYSGTASAADYSGPSTVDFAAGAISTTLTVSLSNDTQDELAETVSISLQDANGVTIGSPSIHEMQIIDDDSAPLLSFNLATQSVREGARTINVGLTLSAGSGRDVRFQVDTDGTAQSQLDYQALPAEFVIPSGVLVFNLPVTLLADGLDEPDETLIISLASADGAQIGSANQHRMTIEDSVTDNDSGGRLPMSMLLLALALLGLRRRVRR